MKASVSTIAFLATAAVIWLGSTAVNQAAQNKPAAAVAAAPAGGTRIAVVNIVRVFDTFEQTVVLNKMRQAYTKALSEQAEKKMKEIQAEQEMLTALAADSAEWYAQNQKIKKMVFETEVWRQIERDNIGESHKSWVQRTYQMMKDEIEKLAKARGIDIVLTKEELKADLGDSKALLAQILNIKVVYASSNPAVDLTDEVLINLNAEFQRRGGAAAIEFNK